MLEMMSPVDENNDLHSQTVKRGINWIFAIAVVGFHIGALAALFNFRWSALVIFFVMWILAQNVGIAMGYHRLLTHRGYSTPKWMEYCIATCGTLALQGGPIYWVAVHRMHHRYTDRQGDPHSPRDGKWWSHMGWILNGSLRNETEALQRYAPDIARDPYYRWLNRYHWLPLTIVGLSLLAIGGWSWILWGAFLPVTIGFHVTWMVNSVTHIWGSRRFSTNDDSRNNFWVALLTGGEGWHNNHHAHPVSARHGLAWYEVDLNYYLICLLKGLGLVTQIKTANSTIIIVPSSAVETMQPGGLAGMTAPTMGLEKECAMKEREGQIRTDSAFPETSESELLPAAFTQTFQQNCNGPSR